MINLLLTLLIACIFQNILGTTQSLHNGEIHAEMTISSYHAINLDQDHLNSGQHKRFTTFATAGDKGSPWVLVKSLSRYSSSPKATPPGRLGTVPATPGYSRYSVLNNRPEVDQFKHYNEFEDRVLVITDKIVINHTFTNNSSSWREDDKLTLTLLTAGDSIFRYISPMLVVFGVVGNSLSLCVMLRRQNREQVRNNHKYYVIFHEI